MAEEQNSGRKPVKVGVRVGGGPPPGYRWNVNILDLADAEANSVLSDVKYAHMRAVIRDLAREQDPTHAVLVDVRQVEDFYEVKDKGGILGKTSVRVFFVVLERTREIVILGVTKKEKDGQTPPAVKIKIRRRVREYLDRRLEGTDSRD